MNVLIVDDTGYVRIILKHVLNAIGITEISEASDGQNAFLQYRLQSPDLVIMDITMPRKNGLEAVKSIIKFDPNAKIIMCSAMAQRNLIIDCIHAGALDFIAKPFDITNLTRVINRVLNTPII
jgi:two-component system chemotaxis response regulator CheY